MSIFAVGDELHMSEWLINLWTSLTTKDLWTMWDEGIIYGFTVASGIFDDTPLFNLLTEIFDEAPHGIQRRLVVSTVDTKTGNYVQYTEAKPKEEWPTMVISSASIPAVFVDRKYDDNVLMDGGTVWNTNVETAINRCLELVDSPSQIVLDIAICGHAEIETITSTSNTVSNLLRYREIKKYYGTMDDVMEQVRTQPEINFRYLLVPSEPLPGGVHMLFFNQTHIQDMINLGKADTEKVLALGEGKGFKLLEGWTQDKTLADQFDNFHQYMYSTLA